MAHGARVNSRRWKTVEDGRVRSLVQTSTVLYRLLPSFPTVPLPNPLPLPTLALPMAPTALVVLTTLANDADARALVTALVAARLVACGTLLPGARSIYRWEGQVTEEGEVVVLLKTDASRWEALCAAVRERHPYQVPELLALPVARGLEQYLSWLTSEVVG